MMMNGRFRVLLVLLPVVAVNLVAADDTQWIRVSVLLESGSGVSQRVEETLVPGGVYSLEEVDERGLAAIDGEILKRVRRLGDGMRSVESSMRLATLLARQYYLRLEVGEKAVLPVIDLNPRLGIVFEPQRFLDGRMDCRVQFLEPAGLPDSPEFTGDPITIRLQDANLTDVLKTFSKLLELDVIIDPSVSGKVSVDLRDVPWDQALDLILRISGLGWQRDGEALRIAPLEEMSRRKKVRTDATINLPRRMWGSATVASRGDVYNPTVVLYVESVDGPPRLVAERDGLVRATRAVLVDPSSADLERSSGDLVVFRARVTVDGELEEPMVLDSPTKAYAGRFLEALAHWRLSSVLDEQGRKREAIVGFGVRLQPRSVAVPVGPIEHIGVEISARTHPDDPAIFIIEAMVKDLDSGQLISAPRITAQRGKEASARTGLVSPSGEPSALEMKFLVSEDGKNVSYSWRLLRNGTVLSEHKAELRL
jgi:hypothetical protein